MKDDWKGLKGIMKLFQLRYFCFYVQYPLTMVMNVSFPLSLPPIIKLT